VAAPYKVLEAGGKVKNMKSLDLAELTWVGVRDYLKRREDVLLPFGSVEEHGYHLPLSTDGDVARAIAEALSARTGIAVAPVVWYGVSNTTRAYTGTTMAAFNSFKAYVGDILQSLKDSGFSKVYLLSGHLSSSQIGAIKEASRGVKGLKAYFLDMTRLDFSDILDTEPFHACEAETSLMLYLHPEKVDMGKAVDEEIEEEKYAVGGLIKTKSGVFGFPTRAEEGKGKAIFERIVEEFAGVIESNL
jgi:creatinine amidohydrolase